MSTEQSSPPANPRQSSFRWLWGISVLMVLICIGGWAGTMAYQAWVDRQIDSGPPPRVPKNAPYIPSPQDVVDRMLELAELDEHDLVYDLGCGDGRIVITAAQRYGCRGIGYEYDAKIAELARENARQAGVSDLVTIEQRDIFTLDQEELERASVITLYLLPWMNEKLQPQLARLGAGKIIISHEWDLPGAKPSQSEQIDSQDDDTTQVHRILKWTTPLKP